MSACGACLRPQNDGWQRRFCDPVIVFSETGRLAGCLAVGAECRDGGSAGRPEARAAPESPRPCRFIPPSRGHDENSAARRVFVPDGTTAGQAASVDR
jgi:hypothetical protein